MKLFLDKFYIKSAVINSELPQNSRYFALIISNTPLLLASNTFRFACYRRDNVLLTVLIGPKVNCSSFPFHYRHHIIQQFNQGVFDYLIATDEDLVDQTEEGDEEDIPSSTSSSSSSSQSKMKKVFLRLCDRSDTILFLCRCVVCGYYIRFHFSHEVFRH